MNALNWKLKSTLLNHSYLVCLRSDNRAIYTQVKLNDIISNKNWVDFFVTEDKAIDIFSWLKYQKWDWQQQRVISVQMGAFGSLRIEKNLEKEKINDMTYQLDAEDESLPPSRPLKVEQETDK